MDLIHPFTSNSIIIVLIKECFETFWPVRDNGQGFQAYKSYELFHNGRIYISSYWNSYFIILVLLSYIHRRSFCILAACISFILFTILCQVIYLIVEPLGSRDTLRNRMYIEGGRTRWSLCRLIFKGANISCYHSDVVS